MKPGTEMTLPFAVGVGIEEGAKYGLAFATAGVALLLDRPYKSNTMVLL